MKLKIEPFLMKKGNRVAKGAIEFEEGFLKGFHMVGFTICDDAKDGLFVLFPSSIIHNREDGEKNKPFFFLRPSNSEQLGELEALILDTYESMVAFNTPKEKVTTKVG